MNTPSRKSIIQQIIKRFETTIIGSLARIENNFGYLWGHDTNHSLNAQQQKFEELWEFTRTSILNHGNKQMREAIDEIIQYLEQENDELRYKITILNQKRNPEERQ